MAIMQFDRAEPSTARPLASLSPVLVWILQLRCLLLLC